MALALDFPSVARARALVTSYAAALRNCSGGAAAPPAGRSAVQVLLGPKGVQVTRRVDDAAPSAERTWTELMSRTRSRVILVAANTSQSDTLLDVASLVTGLRAGGAA